MTSEHAAARSRPAPGEAGRGQSRFSVVARPAVQSGARRPVRPNRWLSLIVLAAVALAVAPYHLLLPKVPLSGVIRDGVSAEPIRGARVRLGTTTTTTAADGSFAIERASLAERLYVEADGYHAAQVAPWPPRGQQVRLTPRTFALSVRDAETNAPIPDAVAIAEGVRLSPVELGRFRAEPAREGVSLTISATGYRSTVVRYRGEGEVVAALQPRILGTVVDGATGRPVGGAFLAHGDVAVTTDAGGTFELESRPAGPLRVLAPGYRRAELDASQDRTLVARLEPLVVRALYLTYFGVGDLGLRQNVVGLAERTEVNAVVIDVKGDRGRLSYRSAVPLAQAIGANAQPTVPNVGELLADLKGRGIYTIARIVVFRDDVLARNGHLAGLDVAVKDRSGQRPWADGEGMAWVDPLRPEVWEYNIALAREAAEMGFDEVQFDDVRFPADGPGTASGPAHFSRIWVSEQDRIEAIGGFLRRARDEVRLAGAFVGANVFGYAAWNDGDEGIGQDVAVLAGAVDYLCPTLFPSSFRAGLPGLVPFPQVVARPYEVAFESVRRARARVEPHGAVLRPWLQYFDDYAWQTGRAYRAAEIDAQRRGAAAAGATGWMMWDPSNRYSRGGLGTRP